MPESRLTIGEVKKSIEVPATAMTANVTELRAAATTYLANLNLLRDSVDGSTSLEQPMNILHGTAAAVEALQAALPAISESLEKIQTHANRI